MNESPTKNGVQEIQLDSWREFHELSAKMFSTAPAYIYRGQTNYDWPLRSGLDRLEARYPKRKNMCNGEPDFFSVPPLPEEDHLRAFKSAIRGRRGSHAPPLTDDEYWALGQHHGLATPLVDWTRSPWIALFFAFEEEKYFGPGDEWLEPKHRGVYVLSTSTIPECNEDEEKVVCCLSPEIDVDYRLINQAALFLRMPGGTVLEPYVEKHFPGDHPDATFMKIKIPNAERDECLIALNKMNINYMTLFPDIDGAAKHVNSRWRSGHEDSIAYI